MKKSFDDSIPEAEWTPDPDAWSIYVSGRSMPAKKNRDIRHPTMTSEELQAMVDQYLQSGGKIRQIAIGVSAEDTLSLDYRMVHAAMGPHESYDNKRKISREEAIRRAHKRIYGEDQALVAGIRTHAAMGLARKEILNIMGISDDRLQRLIRDHMRSDPNVSRYARSERQ